MWWVSWYATSEHTKYRGFILLLHARPTDSYETVASFYVEFACMGFWTASRYYWHIFGKACIGSLSHSKFRWNWGIKCLRKIVNTLHWKLIGAYYAMHKIPSQNSIEMQPLLRKILLTKICRFINSIKLRWYQMEALFLMLKYLFVSILLLDHFCLRMKRLISFARNSFSIDTFYALKILSRFSYHDIKWSRKSIHCLHSYGVLSHVTLERWICVIAISSENNNKINSAFGNVQKH